MILPEVLAEGAVERVARHLSGDDVDQANQIPPRRRLLDLIAFIRAASDEELGQFLDQAKLKPRNPSPSS
jgi:hypothetical protein